MTAQYSVAPVDIAHCAGAVSALWGASLEAGAGPDAQRKLERLYRHNPAEPGLCLGLTPGPAAMPAPVGVIGVLPRIWHRGAERLIVGALADFAVAAEHRSLGPALQLMRAAVEQSRRRHAWLYGRPNPRSEAVCKRAGLREIGQATRYVKVLRSDAQVRAWWRGRAPARVAAVATGATARAVDLALWSDDTGRRLFAGAWRHWEEVGLDRLPLLSGAMDRDPVGAAVDSIWHDCEREALCLGERSAALLHWRFADSTQGWRLALARDRQGRPQGHVVWRLEQGVAWVGDFLARRPLRDTGALMAGFAGWLRNRPVRAIDVGFFGHPAVAQGLLQAGFRARPVAAPIYATSGQDGQGPPAAEAWYTTLFDEDVDG